MLARRYESTGDAVILFPVDGDGFRPTDVFDGLTATHDGDGNFVVRQFLGRGLADEIGPYDGTVRFSSQGIFGVEISADGNWSIDLEWASGRQQPTVLLPPSSQRQGQSRWQSDNIVRKQSCLSEPLA